MENLLPVPLGSIWMVTRLRSWVKVTVWVAPCVVKDAAGMRER